jgi:hypothetical protein
MNTRSNPPSQFFSKDDLPVRTRREKRESTKMAESNPERAQSSSESKEEEGSVSDMPPPDQEPPKLPDLEVIRNKRSQSKAKSVTRTQTQTAESKVEYPTSSWFSSSKPEDTWRDKRAESAQREQRRKEEYWN